MFKFLEILKETFHCISTLIDNKSCGLMDGDNNDIENVVMVMVALRMRRRMTLLLVTYKI
jgi:hypothetical protein